MSIIFQDNECYLLSHKAAVDRACPPTNNGTKFVLREALFEINSQYLRNNQPGIKAIESWKREKIKRKKDRIVIDQNPGLHELVRI